MPEFIEREALRDEILNDPTFDNDTINYYLDVVDSQPSADVVEVVRCKDCKHNPNLNTQTKGMFWCRKFRNEVNPYDFCSYGERRALE